MKTCAIIFGLSPTGHGVARSLARKNIRCVGVDHKKNVAYYSKYVTGKILPHPKDPRFKAQLRNLALNHNEKLAAYICDDTYLKFCNENETFMSNYFLYRHQNVDTREINLDKQKQYERIHHLHPTPTLFEGNKSEVTKALSSQSSSIIVKPRDPSLNQNLPQILKPSDMDPTLRHTLNALHSENLLSYHFIEGPATQHYKYCAYYSQEGQPLAEFCLQKIRQHPPSVGIGSSVRSTRDHRVLQAGRKILDHLNHTGIASIEFKFCTVTKKLYFIELNARYWQQNYLSTKCGINFAHLQYLDLKGRRDDTTVATPQVIQPHTWVSTFRDYQSARAQGTSLLQWIKSLDSRIVFETFDWRDIVPSLVPVLRRIGIA